MHPCAFPVPTRVGICGSEHSGGARSSLGSSSAPCANQPSLLAPVAAASCPPGRPARLSGRLGPQAPQLSPEQQCHTVSLWLLGLLAVAVPLLMAQRQQDAHELGPCRTAGTAEHRSSARLEDAGPSAPSPAGARHAGPHGRAAGGLPSQVRPGRGHASACMRLTVLGPGMQRCMCIASWQSFPVLMRTWPVPTPLPSWPQLPAVVGHISSHGRVEHAARHAAAYHGAHYRLAAVRGRYHSLSREAGQQPSRDRLLPGWHINLLVRLSLQGVQHMLMRAPIC